MNTLIFECTEPQARPARRSVEIGAGDEVVTPSLTWVSTVNLIVLAGARPVFADVDRDTLMMGAGDAEKVLTDHGYPFIRW